MKTEVYYQYLYDVPVKPDDTTHVMCSLNFGGQEQAEYYRF